MERQRITKIVLAAVAFWAVLILLEVLSGPSIGLFSLQVVDITLLIGLTWREAIRDGRRPRR